MREGVQVCIDIELSEYGREHACRDDPSEMIKSIRWGTRAMRRRQFYSANGFVSGNRVTSNFFSKGRYPHNVALTTYFRSQKRKKRHNRKATFSITFITEDINLFTLSLLLLLSFWWPFQGQTGIGMNTPCYRYKITQPNSRRWNREGMEASIEISSGGVRAVAVVRDACGT
ncbi:hypothetical protein LXL04_034475 [Taraxacum kok-saghyz]